jgi:hypothetical protein
MDREAAVPSPEVLLERAEAHRILAELVVALPEPYRTTVLLRYHEGLTGAQIAAAQGIPAGSVRWRLKHALDRLRDGLDSRYRGDRRAWCLALLSKPQATGAFDCGPAYAPSRPPESGGMDWYTKLSGRIGNSSCLDLRQSVR